MVEFKSREDLLRWMYEAELERLTDEEWELYVWIHDRLGEETDLELQAAGYCLKCLPGECRCSPTSSGRQLEMLPTYEWVTLDDEVVLIDVSTGEVL